ncbi:MAG: NIPSNAP family protein [SAR202 cluster bacterium Casp-Chloro-G2]|nr:MAG: NIPSNAP family protein [SAR202 cluster bacterium Casp-Chloro-G2]
MVGDVPDEGTPEFIRKNKMVFDYRQYTFKPGSIPTYMAAVEEVGVPVRKRHGVKLAGWYYSELGDLNQVAHIWAYNDLKHLKEAKDAVASDPEWTGSYVPRVSGLLVAQNTYLMNTSEFGPVPK